MKKILFALAIPLSVLISVTSCNEPTLIGSDLLEQDEADLRFTDTLTLKTRTVTEDSVVTYTIDNQFNIFPCGNFEDPVFGILNADIYAQFREGALDPPSFENPRLDSLVLTLAYDTINSYGIFDEPYQLEIRRISEDLDNSQKFYSNESFSADMSPIGSINFTPEPLQRADYVTVLDRDTVESNFISIRLDDQLGQDMLNEAWYEEGAFIEMLKGLKIELANTTPTKGLMSFNMNSSFTRLRLYYRNFTSEPDTVATVYDFGVTGTTTPRHVNIEHDFSGAIVEDFINDPTKGDSLAFLQAMAGPNIELEIPHLFSLGDIIVNKAELNFYVAELMEDMTDVYTPTDRLILTVQDEDGETLLTIDDVVQNGAAFDGTLSSEEVNGSTIQKYTMNIASYLNRKIIEKTTGSVKFFLRAFPKQESTKRVVIYGAGHSQFPVEFEMTYTQLDN